MCYSYSVIVYSLCNMGNFLCETPTEGICYRRAAPFGNAVSDVFISVINYLCAIKISMSIQLKCFSANLNISIYSDRIVTIIYLGNNIRKCSVYIGIPIWSVPQPLQPSCYPIYPKLINKSYHQAAAIVYPTMFTNIYMWGITV